MNSVRGDLDQSGCAPSMSREGPWRRGPIIRANPGDKVDRPILQEGRGFVNEKKAMGQVGSQSPFEPGAEFRDQVSAGVDRGKEMNIMRGEFGEYGLAEDPTELLLLSFDGSMDLSKKSSRSEIKFASMLCSQVEKGPKGGNTNAEEFIQVRREDGQEADAFMKGDALVGRLLQNAAVEGKPTDIAIVERGGASLFPGGHVPKNAAAIPKERTATIRPYMKIV